MSFFKFLTKGMEPSAPTNTVRVKDIGPGSPGYGMKPKGPPPAPLPVINQVMPPPTPADRARRALSSKDVSDEKQVEYFRLRIKALESRLIGFWSMSMKDYGEFQLELAQLQLKLCSKLVDRL